LNTFRWMGLLESSSVWMPQLAVDCSVFDGYGGGYNRLRRESDSVGQTDSLWVHFAIADSHRQYLFVTPDGSPPEAAAFTPIEWSWIVAQLRAVLDSDYGSYPVRTTNQIDDFVDTIETELTMTDHERNEAAKAELYIDHYEEMTEVTQVFENEWDGLIDNWSWRLVTSLDAARLVDNPEDLPPIPEDDILLELPDEANRRRYWLCRQGNNNWAWLFPTDWWTHLDRVHSNSVAWSPPLSERSTVYPSSSSVSLTISFWSFFTAPRNLYRREIAEISLIASSLTSTRYPEPPWNHDHRADIWRQLAHRRLSLFSRVRQ